MIERMNIKRPDSRSCSEIFACRMPDSTIEHITFEFLPSKLKKNIRGKNDCSFALQINHPDQSRSFVGESAYYDSIHVQDRNEKDKYLGEGQVYIENVEDELYIPVVGFTYTTRKFREKGIGTRRLIVMDSVSRILFNEPLYSSTTPRLAQKSVWEHLVEQEYAEIHEFKGIRRYKFI